MKAAPGLAGPELKPYLTYSLGAHLALAAVAARLLAGPGAAAKSTVYTIDFVGGTATTITTPGPAASAAAAPSDAARPAPQAEFDEFGRRKGRRVSLQRPSLLKGYKERPQERDESAAPQGAAPASAGGAGGSGEAGVEAGADMPNFPYPWYITRVRQMLWAQWSVRMPRHAAECVVVFSLLPNGSVVDLRTESSSGDGAFDLAALSAVQDAAPYPPLPGGFDEPFLKVHVTLRSQ